MRVPVAVPPRQAQIRRMDRRSLLKAGAGAGLAILGAPAILRQRYRAFAFAPDEYSARTIRLIQESPVVDMLCQFAFADFREEPGPPKAQRWLNDPRSFTAEDFAVFRSSGVTALALGHGAPSFEASVQWTSAWNGFIASRSEWFRRVDTVDDLKLTAATGRIGIILTTQDANHFRGVNDVETFYRLGQRVAQLTYNTQNRIGAGFLEHRDGGLTVFGHDILKKMEEVGMAVDLSHCADQTTMDAIAAATKPPIFTHGTARGLLPDCLRCKTDESIRALAAKGGVVGIAMIRFMVRPEAPVTVEHVADHVEHIMKIAGAEHVGIGSDLDMAGLANPIPRSGPIAPTSQPNFSRYNAYFAEDGGAHVDGLNHPKRVFDLVETMVRRRHSDATIRGLLGGNFIRAMSQVWR